MRSSRSQAPKNRRRASCEVRASRSAAAACEVERALVRPFRGDLLDHPAGDDGVLVLAEHVLDPREASEEPIGLPGGAGLEDTDTTSAAWRGASQLRDPVKVLVGGRRRRAGTRLLQRSPGVGHARRDRRPTRLLRPIGQDRVGPVQDPGQVLVIR